MDLAFSAEDIAFRDEVRAWIKATYPDEMRARVERSPNGHIAREDHVWWQKKLHERGWIAPNWPKEYGGAGFTPSQKYIFQAELAAANTPQIMPFGLTMVAPVIMKFGSPEQKAKYLPDILASNVWWCQGYSEPGSGSDLASLQMKAEDKGDHYLCNGSKIWTTLAQYADMIFCLVRTKSAPGKPQEGISFLLIDMKSPGITIRPLVTLDNAPEGSQEVNQVLFDDVKVPKGNLIGEEGKGWTYAKYLLEFERGNPYSGGLRKALARVRRIAEAEGDGAGRLADDPGFQARIAETEVAITALEFTELRIIGTLTAGQNMGATSSILKTRGTELQQQVQELALEAIGAYAVPFNVPAHGKGSNLTPIGPDYANVTAPSYFNGRKTSIYAGSNEIQRNIMAKLVLGL
ncbi:acyl-CoA dehydrogenase family protein [Zavarzinia sp. CC-PAN008]|uniref:acyl-CoA dehydrogenase family protein n=1 Tax=Zavarzinia sp. CC-PAN008 TaxID=3243332 RepID=UPI003F74AAE0